MNTQSGLWIIQGASWVEEARFANLLLRLGARVLWVQERSEAANAPPAGSLMIDLDDLDEGDADLVFARARAAGVVLKTIGDSASFTALPLRSVRVGLYGGGGAPFNHAGVFGAAGFPVRFISDAQIRAGELDTIDVLVMPGGGIRAMYGQLEPLGISGARAISDWVRAGGMYIGSCAGAYDCAIAGPSFNTSCPPKGELQLVNARIWNGGGSLGGEVEGLASPGVGTLRVRNTRPDHPVMTGMPDEFDIVHYNGPVFEVLDASEIEGASLATGLAAFAGSTKRFTAGEHLMGEADTGSPTLLQRATDAGRHSVVAGELGVGRTVAFGSHPEFGFDLAMNAWGQPARMLVNAALWQAASTSSARRPWSYRETPGSVSIPRGSSTAVVDRLARQVLDDVALLAQRPITEPPTWLTRDYAMSVFGLSPVEIWSESLQDIASIANEVIALAEHLRTVISDIGTSALEREAVAQIDRWILEHRPDAWQQDCGYQGVASLLRTAHDMLRSAHNQWDVELGPPAGPYDYFLENPYHLVAGSYLAAVGCMGGAVQLLRALDAELSLVVSASAQLTVGR